VVESKPVFRLGLNYRVGSATFLRASWGQGYRYPTIAEKFISTNAGGIMVVPNPGLTSETGWSMEVGLKQGFQIGRFGAFFDIAGFWTEYNNMIEFNVDWSTFPFPFLAKNIGDTVIKGVDMNITGQGDLFGIPTTILTGYTYIDPKFQDFTEDNEISSSVDYNILKYRFRHTFKLDVESQFNKFSVGVAAFYNSEMEAIDFILGLLAGIGDYREANPGGNTTWNLRLGYKFIEGGKASLLVRNVFNEEYSRRPGLLEAPRNITLRVDYTF